MEIPLHCIPDIVSVSADQKCIRLFQTYFEGFSPAQIALCGSLKDELVTHEVQIL